MGKMVKTHHSDHDGRCSAGKHRRLFFAGGSLTADGRNRTGRQLEDHGCILQRIVRGG